MHSRLIFIGLFFLWGLLPLKSPAQSDPYLLVLNKSDHTAWQINAESGKRIKSYSTGKGPHEVAVSPNKQWAAITNYGSKEAGHTLTVLNLDTRSVAKTIDISPFTRPHGIDWFPDSRRVIVTSETRKAVIIVDIKKGKVLQSLPTGQQLSHMVALAPDARRAFTTNIGSGSVSVIDLQGDSAGQPSHIIQTGKGTEGIEIVDSQNQGWFTNRASNTISVIDLETLEPIDTLKSPGFPIRLAASPDQKWIAATHAKSDEVAIFDLQTRQSVSRISLRQSSAKNNKKRFIEDRFGKGAVPIGLAFSEDGETLYVSASRADVIAVIEPDRWTVTRTISTGTEPDGIDFFRR